MFGHKCDGENNFTRDKVQKQALDVSGNGIVTMSLILIRLINTRLITLLETNTTG